MAGGIGETLLQQTLRRTAWVFLDPPRRARPAQEHRASRNLVQLRLRCL